MDVDGNGSSSDIGYEMDMDIDEADQAQQSSSSSTQQQQQRNGKKVFVFLIILDHHLFQAKRIETRQNSAHRLLERFWRSVWKFEFWNLTITALLNDNCAYENYTSRDKKLNFRT